MWTKTMITKGGLNCEEMSCMPSNIYKHGDFAKKPIQINAQAIKRAIYGWKECYQIPSLRGKVEEKSFDLVYSCLPSFLDFGMVDYC